MFKASFKNVDELRDFLNHSDFDEVKFCVNPDYIEAVIGISDEGKVVYDYDIMVEHLAKIYEKDGESEDPYLDAMDWIDYNCDTPYWEIVLRNAADEIDFDNLTPEVPEKFNQYRKTIIGQNRYGIWLIDSELVNNQNLTDIKSTLGDYKIV